MRNDGEIVIGTKLDTKSFDKQIAEVEYELAQIDYELSHAKELKLDQRAINEYTKKAEQLNNKLIDLRKRQEDLDSKNLFGRISGSIDTIIKKITRWGLAIFGVRSAFMAVKRATSTISQYNDQIKTDLEYIQYSLATALEPVIKVIINLAYQLLNVINSISIAMFQYDLFQNASVDKFKKMNAGANQLKKTLSGFDEMNVLQDTSGGGAGVTTPSGSFDKSQGKEFVSFWEKIIKFWEEDWEQAFASIGGMWDTFFESIGYLGKGFYDIFKGIIETIKGLWQMLVALFKGDTEALSTGWQNFIGGIKNIFIGLIEGIVGLLLMVLGTVKGLFLELLGAIYNIFIKPLWDLISGLWNLLVTGANWAVDKVFSLFKGLLDFMTSIVKKILSLFGTIGTKVGDVIGSAFKTVINGVLKAIENILNFPIKSINKLIDTINKVPGINLGKLQTFSLPRLAKGTIASVPGRGIPTPSGIYAEAGREAYLPLSDTALLEELGSTIGKYVTINANITNTMNGRVISRELQKIQNDSDFAFNR